MLAARKCSLFVPPMHVAKHTDFRRPEKQTGIRLHVRDHHSLVLPSISKGFFADASIWFVRQKLVL